MKSAMRIGMNMVRICLAGMQVTVMLQMRPTLRVKTNQGNPQFPMFSDAKSTTINIITNDFFFPLYAGLTV
jgi:hypothetical protein